MTKLRLLGIEFIRALSSYAVVLVHSGDETWKLPIDTAAIQFRLQFYFGVPFFLAVSFYFLTTKIELIYSPKFWISKVQRILIPYALWSSIFLVFRIAIFTATNKTARLQHLIADPLSVIFLGGASYHLYFLPLLFVGTLLILTAPLLTRFKIDNLTMIFIVTLAIVFYSLMESSGNGFQLGETNTAFKSLIDALNIDIQQYPLLRFILVNIAWAIRCLPYLSIALILHKWRVAEKFLNAKPAVAIGLAFLSLTANTLGKMLLPLGLSEVILAFTLLLFSMSISKYFTNNSINNSIANVGLCSFGIYLIHPFVMYFVKSSIGKIIPTVINSVSIFSMSILSFSCFLMSWALVAGMIRNKKVGKYLLGV